MKDLYNRQIDYLRLSVTERCNLACKYCKPTGCESHSDYLTEESILQSVKLLQACGIKKVKVTGGEPLIRKDILSILKQIKNMEGIEAVTLTTNGLKLGQYAKQLADIGIDGINVSLDTLDPQKYHRLTGVDQCDQVIDGIHKALEVGIKNIKINVVAMNSLTEADIKALLGFVKNDSVHIRFIELMPIGYGKQFEPFPIEALHRVIEEMYGPLQIASGCYGNGPAVYYTLEGFKGKIGFINAVSHKFCESCNRIRLTSEGFLRMCLHHKSGIDMRPLLDQDIEVAKIHILEALQGKPKQHDFSLEQEETIDFKEMYKIGG